MKLPFQPEKSGWSWADLGLLGIHDYAARRATTLRWSPGYPSTQPSPSPLSETESHFSVPSSLAPRSMFPSFAEDPRSATSHRETNFLRPVPTMSYASPMPSEIISSSRVRTQHREKRHGDKRVARKPTSQPYEHQPVDMYGQSPLVEHDNYVGAPERWQQQTSMASMTPETWASPYSSPSSQSYYGSSPSPGSNAFIDTWPR